MHRRPSPGELYCEAKDHLKEHQNYERAEQFKSLNLDPNDDVCMDYYDKISYENAVVKILKGQKDGKYTRSEIMARQKQYLNFASTQEIDHKPGFNKKSFEGKLLDESGGKGDQDDSKECVTM